MSIQNLIYGGFPVFCMNEAGAGEGGGGGETPGTPTDDGTGGKAGMFESGSDGGDGSSDGGTPDKSDNDGQVDLNKLLGEELAKDPNFEKFAKAENPVQEMAKSLLEAQKQVGKPKVGVPGENATDEEKSAFYESLGVPKDADGYGFEKPEGMPDEMYDAEDAKSWAEFFKENNLTKDQANAARDRFIEIQTEQALASNTALNEAMDQHFGDQKQVIAKQASALMQQAVPDAELRATIQAAIGDENTPAFAAALGFAVQHMKKTYGLSDENFGEGGDGGGKSSVELRADAQKLMSSDAYRDGMHRDHKDTVKKVNDMYKQIGELSNAEASRRK